MSDKPAEKVQGHMGQFLYQTEFYVEKQLPASVYAHKYVIVHL